MSRSITKTVQSGKRFFETFVKFIHQTIRYWKHKETKNIINTENISILTCLARKVSDSRKEFNLSYRGNMTS